MEKTKSSLWAGAVGERSPRIRLLFGEKIDERKQLVLEISKGTQVKLRCSFHRRSFVKDRWLGIKEQ
jgi:hypothetical protein